ncbi:MAG: HAD family phosphatase [Ignavibacteriae bacterium]|nr:HAD family phosphatase [Ignavibacteriota bacterium]
MEIETIIFDLGGVLFNINHERTRAALSALSENPEKINFSLLSQNEVFNQFEAGRITSAQFRNELRSLYGISGSDSEIDSAWNAMLIGLFPDSIDMLQSLKQSYRIALLSNINDIHYSAIEQECLPLFLELHDCFLSYSLGLRKPEHEIYQHVLKAMNVIPEKTLFIDDAPQNIQTARSLGIQTYHVTSQNPLRGILKSITKGKL